MTRVQEDRVELLQGTLDVLILQILTAGPAHGHAIAKRIKQQSKEILQVETGSLYPALHRMEARGWIAADWQQSDRGKRAKYYRLQPSGRRQLAAEQSRWQQFAYAMGLVLQLTETR